MADEKPEESVRAQAGLLAEGDGEQRNVEIGLEGAEVTVVRQELTERALVLPSEKSLEEKMAIIDCALNELRQAFPNIRFGFDSGQQINSYDRNDNHIKRYATQNDEQILQAVATRIRNIGMFLNSEQLSLYQKTVLQNSQNGNDVSILFNPNASNEKISVKVIGQPKFMGLTGVITFDLPTQYNIRISLNADISEDEFLNRVNFIPRNETIGNILDIIDYTGMNENWMGSSNGKLKLDNNMYLIIRAFSDEEASRFLRIITFLSNLVERRFVEETEYRPKWENKLNPILDLYRNQAKINIVIEKERFRIEYLEYPEDEAYKQVDYIDFSDDLSEDNLIEQFTTKLARLSKLRLIFKNFLRSQL